MGVGGAGTGDQRRKREETQGKGSLAEDGADVGGGSDPSENANPSGGSGASYSPWSYEKWKI